MYLLRRGNNLLNMSPTPTKSKTNYKSKEDTSNPKDNFYTPRYATEILLPFIPETDFIWECAAGDGAISNILEETKKYTVVSSDLRDAFQNDFFKDSAIPIEFLRNKNSIIITNPPFGLKEKFYNRCVELGHPFALLIPTDYSRWIINAIKDGSEKIIPERRIDYITPYVCELVYKKELKTLIEKETNQKFKKYENIPGELIENFGDRIEYHNYWRDIPEQLIRKHSSSDFHSMWFTKGFNLGKTETFVELTNEMKNRIL